MSEKHGPIILLTNKLRCGPRSLSVLLQWLSNADDYKEFVEIVRRLLPDHEHNILRELDPCDQMTTFFELFSKNYFPLDEIWIESGEYSYGDLIRYMPIQVNGMECEEYEEIPNQQDLSIQLLTYLLEDQSTGGTGARVALADSLLKQDIPLRLLERVPENGLSHEEAIRIFQGSKHEGVGIWSQMLNLCTNSYYYDVTREMCEEMPGWSQEEIDNLCYDWRWAQMLRSSLDQTEAWLDKEPIKHFAELLDYIEGNQPDVLPGQPRLLIDIFEEGGEDGQEEEGRPHIGLTTIP